MANIVPDGWREYAVTGAAQREIETLAMLAAALPDAYTVYHAVHWTRLEHGYSVYGEIDFVVVNQAGAMLLIEQKSGFLEEGPDGLVKRYAEKTKSVPMQMARSVAAMQNKLRARPGCRDVHLDYLLYCPDYQIKQLQTAGISPERIVDARRRDQLAAIVGQILPPGDAAAANPDSVRQVHRFLRDIVQLETDVSALIGRARGLVTRIAGGLAHWARQLEFTPFRLRVSGTAGSGKTQLALAEYRAAVEQGKRPLYVCYNRPLADHFQLIAPPGGHVCTLHMLCDQRLRAAGELPDFSQPDAFETLLARAAALPVEADWLFDTVIVDEGQDFSEAWRDLALRHLKPEGRALWLEDPLQNLYARAPVELPGWVRIHATSNYRSPRSVVRMLQNLLPEEFSIEAQGALQSSELVVLTYKDAAELTQQVKEGIRQCLAEGFKKADIAVVSYSGREKSLLFPYTELGPHRLKTYTGRYDLLGQPIYSDGDVLLESVYRFKGQSAPAIVFAEIDFDQLDERAVRKLFVGATRAMMKLVLVVSERSAAQLLERLG
ncbi:MAG: ATP-binding domain-containing protein [Pseudomonadota bacterium]|nr:ATP-binding domain-containing protein [Pseudomonadota bacterium]